MPPILDEAPSEGLFGIEVILPSQFWGAPRRPERGAPERRLMLAVLQDALLVLVSHARHRSRKSRRMAAEVAGWFGSDSRAHPFAFGAICDVLGLDVSFIRGAIARLQQRDGSPGPYRRDYAGRGRHQVERMARLR